MEHYNRPYVFLDPLYSTMDPLVATVYYDNSSSGPYILYKGYVYEASLIPNADREYCFWYNLMFLCKPVLIDLIYILKWKKNTSFFPQFLLNTSQTVK